MTVLASFLRIDEQIGGADFFFDLVKASSQLKPETAILGGFTF